MAGKPNGVAALMQTNNTKSGVKRQLHQVDGL